MLIDGIRSELPIGGCSSFGCKMRDIGVAAAADDGDDLAGFDVCCCCCCSCCNDARPVQRESSRRLCNCRRRISILEEATRPQY